MRRKMNGLLCYLAQRILSFGARFIRVLHGVDDDICLLFHKGYGLQVSVLINQQVYEHEIDTPAESLWIQISFRNMPWVVRRTFGYIGIHQGAHQTWGCFRNREQPNKAKIQTNRNRIVESRYETQTV